VKILHLADVHLDRPFVGMPRDAARRRRQELRAALSRCLDAARDRAVDLVTIGGDLWEDEHVTTDTRRFVAHELGRLAPTPVVLVCGNHDPFVPGGHYSRTPWPANARILDSGGLTDVRLEGVTLWGASWIGRRMDLSFLSSFRVPPDGRTHVLLLHGTLRAIPRPLVGESAEAYAPFDPHDIERCGFDLCLAGHVHAARRLERVVYPGSPEPLGWAEQGRHAYAVITLGRGDPEVELVDVNLRRYEERRVDCDGAASSAAVIERLGSALADADPGSLCLRVQLVGQVGPECQIDPEALCLLHRDRYAALVIRDATSPEYDRDALARQPTALGHFVRSLSERIATAGDPAERDVLELALTGGLRALHGRKDVLHVD
jgi:exonuclease SbcD